MVIMITKVKKLKRIWYRPSLRKLKKRDLQLDRRRVNSLNYLISLTQNGRQSSILNRLRKETNPFSLRKNFPRLPSSSLILTNF